MAWIPLLLCTFICDPTLRTACRYSSLKSGCSVTRWAGGQGTDLEGLRSCSHPPHWSSGALSAGRLQGRGSCSDPQRGPSAVASLLTRPWPGCNQGFHCPHNPRQCLSCLPVSTQRPPPSVCTPWATGHSLPPKAARSFHFWAAVPVNELFLIWR